MLWFGSWVTFFAFWFYALRIARLDSLPLGLVCIALWIAARVGLPALGIEGSFYFLAFAAVLTAAMILFDLYRVKMGLRRRQKAPLDSDS